jgi:spermidine synthase
VPKQTSQLEADEACGLEEPEITLSEEAGIRYLHFGSPWIQGAMRIRRPWEIVIDYVALMQSWLLFLDPPKRILQIGLGAGALTKHSYRFLPQSRIIVLENSAAVTVAARQCFAVPENDTRLDVIVADGEAYLAHHLLLQQTRPERQRLNESLGIIQVDVYDQHARGPVLDSLAFYRTCHEALGDTGMLSVNLFGEPASYALNLARIQEVFGGRVLTWPAVDAGNIVVLAFKGPPLRVNWRSLQDRALVLERAFELPAQKWLRDLRRHPARGKASTTHLEL